MSIKQTMSFPISSDPNNVKGVVNEATDGKKAVPVELVTKAANDSTFTQVTDANGLPVKLTGSNAPEVTMHNAATAGSGTPITTDGFSSLLIQLSGTFVATVVFEGTLNGTDWIAILGQNLNTGFKSSTVYAPGLYAFPVNGLQQVRARIALRVSGNITAKGKTLPTPFSLLSTANLGSELIRVVKSGALAVSTTDPILDTNYPTVLDYIEWSQNHAIHGELQIQMKMADGSLQFLRTVNATGSTTGVRWRPTDFQSSGTPRLLDTIIFSDTAGEYKYATNEIFKGFIFPHGVIISRVNSSSTYADLTMAVVIIGRRVS